VYQFVDYGGYSGGGGGGGSSGGFRDTAAKSGFDEYDAGDDEDLSVRRSGSVRTGGASSRAPVTTAPTAGRSLGARSTAAPVAAPAPPPPQPIEDLLGGFDDFSLSPSAPAPAPVVNAPAPPASNKALPALDGTISEVLRCLQYANACVLDRRL
jgi:epsin